MSIDKSDPRLTAYAFGELGGEEKATVEAELAANPALRADLAEIERAVQALRSEVEAAPPPALDELRRRRIEKAAQPPARKTRRRLMWGFASATAMAAGVMLFATATMHRSADSYGVAWMAGAPAPLATAAPMAAASAALYADQDRAAGGFDREAYDHFEDNPFVSVAADPRSTFSIDVDTASYALVRRHLLQNGVLPPKGAVRIEELVNYFDYRYPEPSAGQPFSVSTDLAAAPWAPEHRLMRIGLKGRHVEPKSIPGSNLVFLVDVSGSMQPENKLPLLKRGLSMLLEQLDQRTTISIVVYAGSSGLILEPTPASQKRKILDALDRLEAGGSTNGAGGIQLAYSLAAEHFVRGGVNRVILATDGDFNVGVTSQSDLVDLVQARAKSGVFLSVLGFGEGNINDSMLEKIADKGNGNYAYIDSVAEAKKVLVEQATGTLVTIAKDVKIQVEFNPHAVQAFRLIGYENRVLSHQDFKDDTKDAGEIGSDHRVTALYEIVPAGSRERAADADALKYQSRGALSPAAESGELATVKLRYKLPDGDQSSLLETPVRDQGNRSFERDPGFRFAAAVAEFGMLLRESPHKGRATYGQVLELASDTATSDRQKELLDMVRAAQRLSGPPR